jgi:tryptophan 2,3-dioxygenase
MEKDHAAKDHLRLEKLNYNSYLKVFELLNLQKELSVPPHHDEMFFIVIHQAAELWFKLMLHETEALITAFRENSISRALKVLRRLTAIMDLQVRQINLLSTLTPVEFAGFRDHLMPASGFQSMQFRLIEFAYGIREDFFLKFFENMPEAKAALEGWLERPSVCDEFIACMKNHAPQPKFQPTIAATAAAPAGASAYDAEKLDEELLGQLREIYENPGENYHWVLLCEGLLDFDEKFAMWRNAHGLMVTRTIGRKRGTGGSSGYQFLQSRMEYRFFPELWAIRSRIGTDYK